MTYRQQLRELANDNYGFVTTRDAAGLGVPAVALRKLAGRGALENVRRGVYRFTDARRTADDAYAQAVAMVGDEAYLVADAVLGLLGLGLVEPKRIRVATARRTRLKDPRFVDIVQRDLPSELITSYKGIRATTAAQAIRDSVGIVMKERLSEALAEAMRQGLIDSREGAEVRKVLTSVSREQVGSPMSAPREAMPPARP